MREPERLLASGVTDFERKLLEAVKEERPSAELQLRMQQGLGLPSGTVPPAPAPTGAALGSGLSGAALSGVALKVILGSLVAGGLAYSVVSLTTIEGDPSASAPAVKHQGTTRAAPQRTSVVAPAAELSAAGATEAEPRSAPVEPGTNEMADDARRAPTDADGLRLEIELLDAVRAASLLGESKRADEALDRYDARFPRGALQREADLLRRASVKATGAAPSAPLRGADPEAASGR